MGFQQTPGALHYSGRFIFWFLASLILRRLQKPINAVIAQATAIGERRFVQAPVATLPELKKLSVAMNSTVSLLQSMFSEEAERLAAARQAANIDHISGLSKRSLFMAQLQIALEQEDAPCASLIFIRLSHLAKINRLFGRDKTDALLQNIGVLLKRQALLHEDGIAARLNGTELALFFKTQEAGSVAQTLLLEISEELEKIENNPSSVFISYAQFEYGIALSELLSQLDSAVASAELAGYSDVRKAAPFKLHHAPKSQEQWSQLIQTAIEQQKVKLVYFPVLNFSGKLVQIESALRLEFEGNWFPAGRFLAIAERLGISARLDLMAIELAWQNYTKTLQRQHWL